MLQMKNYIQLIQLIMELIFFIIIKQGSHSVSSSFFNIKVMKKREKKNYHLLDKFNLIPVLHHLRFLIKL